MKQTNSLQRNWVIDASLHPRAPTRMHLARLAPSARATCHVDSRNAENSARILVRKAVTTRATNQPCDFSSRVSRATNHKREKRQTALSLPASALRKWGYTVTIVFNLRESRRCPSASNHRVTEREKAERKREERCAKSVLDAGETGPTCFQLVRAISLSHPQWLMHLRVNWGAFNSKASAPVALLGSRPVGRRRICFSLPLGKGDCSWQLLSFKNLCSIFGWLLKGSAKWRNRKQFPSSLSILASELLI